ncbi:MULTISPECIES: TRAFAC clade GTPase domain-containing protein [Agrobacterium tumefaciens complex]|uniref:TRAFAC clade GTPase domain-containing protein n=1 Tax=Agrobacterium tumefaciens TaxID=358 RepID=UPI000FE27F3A|nr:hypothetical protein [Agrobacterium tumefaciens]QAB00974.1 hypothetical protein DC439_24555 [Agrobacterium tumefaciens]
MSQACQYEGCTVGETSRCALEKDPDTCPNRVGRQLEQLEVEPPTSVINSDVGAPVLTRPEELPSFPPSTTLGLEAIERMMAARYVTVVGILGDPEAGKTACLASMYLLLSHALLDGWVFADSQSLMAFEEISRGARRWNEGQPPEQMTVHTEMADERQPGFLHLRLRRTKDGKCFDLALPDLPGEWTKTLIRSSRSDRLEFTRSADVIWLVADGRILSDREQRQGAITRLGQLAGRLRSLMNGLSPKLLLVITHRDVVQVSDATLDRIRSEFAKHQLEAEIVPIAPFSDDKTTKPGFGLSTLISSTLERVAEHPVFWPTSESTPGTRSFLSFRRDT